ncbi:putative acetyltransferase [Cystobacter fuscus]|uniref:Putative acetyltransferase n=1 Tax=Cystobacter fuscus TaxID=43 RepID=A0A250JJ74_9BACT|nr:acetyltransferase [Cystobacter fuscus]ATB43176.1 putative acetyltransferase [Cystobacter fuscus]
MLVAQTKTKPRLVIYGCGGHGKVVADIALARGMTVEGFLDDRALEGKRVFGLPILGGPAWLEVFRSEVSVALGIGENRARYRIYKLCERLGMTPVTLIHPTATVAASAQLGAGVVVMAQAVINPDARVANGAIINSGAIVEHDCEIGAFAHLSPNATLGGNVRIGALTHLGLAASVLPGKAVGEETVVGAGAVVTSDIPSRVVVAGVPARVQRQREET